MTFKHLQELTEGLKYWGSSTPDQKTLAELFKKLVKPQGMSDTVEGELLRAINKIYYDYYNNGFGNNWSGALRYLDNNATFQSMKDAYTLEPFSRGRMPTTSDKPAIEKALDDLMDGVIAQILAAGDNLQKNTQDMFDLQQPDDHGYEDDDEEDEDEDDNY